MKRGKLVALFIFLVFLIGAGFVANTMVATKMAQIRVQRLNKDLRKEGLQIVYHSIRATFVPNRITLEDVRLKSLTSGKTYRLKRIILENLKFKDNELLKGKISYFGNLYETLPQISILCLFVKCPETMPFSGFVSLEKNTKTHLLDIKSKFSLRKIGSIGVEALLSNVELNKRNEPLLHKLEIRIEDHGIGDLIIAAIKKKKELSPSEIKKERERLSSSKKLLSLSSNPDPVIREAATAIKRFISGKTNTLTVKLAPSTPLPIDYVVLLLQKGQLSDWKKLGLRITN